MKEKVSDGAEKNRVIMKDEMLRRKNDVEARRIRCTERAPGSKGRRMESRRRDGSRWW